MMRNIVLGDKIIDISTPVVMGILNVTTDSFYDGGKYLREKEIIDRINRIVDEGAGIIDIGAYSTKPGAKDVDEDEELKRLDFALELVRKYYPGLPVSIDTFRPRVAEELSKCFGPLIINDISGGTMDKGMFDYVAKSGLPYILMHIQGTPKNMQDNPQYTNVTEEVKSFLKERIDELEGKQFHNIILDPGFGFGKSVQHNYELFNSSEVFAEMGYPLLIGISRKSMIYKLLDTNPDQALNGTTVLNTIALLKGADILRVHDVKEAVEAVKIVKAMKTSG
ncbi:dihydropteroate synthase [Odoribacter sp. OttesenSCG-928-J03]|nr:dihydropteroate synthase [Odoribacter sp. OttesenSCG-928-J03]MDL2283359.1 dihydropteroate synthase [Odoribacter sp. OttesenSCG-928-G04]